MVRGTSLYAPLRLLAVLLAVSGISNYAGFYELAPFWRALIFFYLAGAAIVFQPELRRLYVNRSFQGENVSRQYVSDEENRSQFIDELALACQTLSRKQTGALIILERNNTLRDFIQTGILVDALFTPELVFALFLPESPLHDGAVIVKENRVIAAGCILPLAEKVEVKKLLGTRHRAAIGITEQTDALSIVVSEETGKISLAVQGKMAWNIEVGALKKMIRIMYRKV